LTGSQILCTGETYKNVVKLTFAKGASLPDPAGLFNASLEGNTRRAIDIHEGDKIDAKALKALIRAAVLLNTRREAGKSPSTGRNKPLTPPTNSGPPFVESQWGAIYPHIRLSNRRAPGS
jgi:hypothetical protein